MLQKRWFCAPSRNSTSNMPKMRHGEIQSPEYPKRKSVASRYDSFRIPFQTYRKADKWFEGIQTKIPYSVSRQRFLTGLDNRHQFLLQAPFWPYNSHDTPFRHPILKHRQFPQLLFRQSSVQRAFFSLLEAIL